MEIRKRCSICGIVVNSTAEAVQHLKVHDGRRNPKNTSNAPTNTDSYSYEEITHNNIPDSSSSSDSSSDYSGGGGSFDGGGSSGDY